MENTFGIDLKRLSDEQLKTLADAVHRARKRRRAHIGEKVFDSIEVGDKVNVMRGKKYCWSGKVMKKLVKNVRVKRDNGTTYKVPPSMLVKAH